MRVTKREFDESLERISSGNVLQEDVKVIKSFVGELLFDVRRKDQKIDNLKGRIEKFYR